MKEKITVFKAFVSREKEEAYLNEMNKLGWKLTSLRFAFYTFVKTEPSEYMTVVYFAERQYQTTFVRTVTECGCDIAHQSNEGKSIIFYVNVPVGSESVGFLTDNQSKLDSKKRLNNSRKREIIVLFIAFAIGVIPVLYPLPALIKIFNHSPDGLYKIIREYLFGFICFGVSAVGGAICGVMGAYLLVLFRRTKQEIKTISNDMQIYE